VAGELTSRSVDRPLLAALCPPPLLLALSHAQAKLFGLAGITSSDSLLFTTLRQRQQQQNSSSPSSFSRQRLDKLCYKPAQQRAPTDPECTFSWQRSRQAEAAARNPSCGYDFIKGRGDAEDGGGGGGGDREGDFLSRMDTQTSHARRRMQERRAEEEYDARQDKVSL
jgi:hypothetical protein